MKDETPDVTADIDRDQMTQVMVNLIKNAIEAMDGKSGEIRIKAEEIDRYRSDPYLGCRPGVRNSV